MKSDAGIVVEARVRGEAAKSASVYLNGKAIGTLVFTKGESAIVAAVTVATTPAIASGRRSDGSRLAGRSWWAM